MNFGLEESASMSLLFTASMMEGSSTDPLDIGIIQQGEDHLKYLLISHDKLLKDLKLGSSGIGHCIPFLRMRFKGRLETDGPDFRLLYLNSTNGIGCQGIDPALRGDHFSADDAAINQLHLSDLTGIHGTDENSCEKERRNNRKPDLYSLSKQDSHIPL